MLTSRNGKWVMKLLLRLGITLATAFLLLVPDKGLAAVSVGGSVASLAFDPSVRAQGMGRASTAVFWGDDPNYWANPALLGYHTGLRYEWSGTHFPLKDVPNDTYFTANRVTLGGWGVGLAMAGTPVSGLGGLNLDYGLDESGNPTGYDRVESWGIGTSVVELAENATRLLGWELPSLSRFGDVSLGTSRNHVGVFYESPVETLAILRATTKNRGFVIRLTPYNSIDFPGLVRGIDSFLRPAIGGLRLDLSYGESIHNYEDVSAFQPVSQTRTYLAKNEKRGLAVHLALGFPGVLDDRLNSANMGWLADWLTPLISWGKAWDRTTASRVSSEPGQRVTEGEYELSGWELTFANVFTIRRGRIDAPTDMEYGLHGVTSGWSIGLRFAQFGGFRYDRATVPRVADFGDIYPRGFSVWVHPLAVRRALRHQAVP